MSNNEYNNENNPIQPQEPEWRRVAKQVLRLSKPEYKWIAMDKNGVWSISPYEPVLYEIEGVWGARNSVDMLMLNIPTCPDWTQSLISREEQSK